MGIKVIIKKVIKKIIGRSNNLKGTDVNGPVFRANAIGSVDVFSYDNHVVHAAGWVFDRKYRMLNPRIAYYSRGERMAEHNYVVLYRSDVAQAVHNEEAESAGMAMTARVETPVDLTVVFEYDTQDGLGGMILGSIPADPAVSEISVETNMDQSQIGDIQYFVEHRTQEKVEFPEELYVHTVDIIVPVYNGLEYFDQLFAGLEKTRMNYRLILIDDQSPDERVRPYLEAYSLEHPGTVFMENENNLGFLGSVNRGLAMAENHVVLLNTDVIVPEFWLERLMMPIIMGEGVATSTPFTNCGTICSFPEFCEDNELFSEMTLEQIDRAFQKIRPQYPAMPTGVGFCMGMNFKVIQEVGLLDAENFGKGYGEENDWCQRAIQKGYKNVHVDNLFVYHKHGGSFPSEEKKKLLKAHEKALLQKHPGYLKDVAAYCQADPMKQVRLFAIVQLLNELRQVKTTAAFDHSLGGGATSYLKQKRQELLNQNQKFVLIRYDIYKNRYKVIYTYKEWQVEFVTEKLENVLKNIQNVNEIWINEFVTYQNIYELMDQVLEWRKLQGAYLKMLLHDYFAVCPAVNLMDDKGCYCEVGTSEKCNQCIPNNKSNVCLDYESGSAWREHWQAFLTECDEITVFSQNSQMLLKKAYPNLKNISLVPHKPHYLPKLKKESKTTDTLNIGVLGVLSYKKGLPVIREMARVIDEKKLNIRLKLIGELDGEINYDCFVETGRYRREQIPRLTLEEDIDIFFIPSIWPETYSYTTSEIMSMDMPIVIFDIGAPVERVKTYGKGMILSTDCGAEVILSKIQSFSEQVCGLSSIPVHKERVLFVAEEISFASRYRAEHFRETLVLQGYASDFVLTENLQEVSVRQYRSIVLYRTGIGKDISQLVEKAKAYRVPVFYDIDDLVFDYDRISYLEFLKGKEYRNFRKITESIHGCMSLCDGFITSTNALEEEIRKEFPDKPVLQKRNVASMEMQVLSVEALNKPKCSDGKVWIGYFSGSATHNKDFQKIEPVIARIMQEYPQVHLRLGGVLQENSLMQYRKRIVKTGFVEWQKLPEIIASVDINLMPLKNSRFHECKSENKWMEAGLVQVPTVMSSNCELERVVKDQETGLLCKTEEEWYQALKMLIESEEIRKQIGKAAHKAVMTRYTTAWPDEEAVNMVLRK